MCVCTSDLQRWVPRGTATRSSSVLLRLIKEFNESERKQKTVEYCSFHQLETVGDLGSVSVHALEPVQTSKHTAQSERNAVTQTPAAITTLRQLALAAEVSNQGLVTPWTGLKSSCALAEGENIHTPSLSRIDLDLD